mgnify:CR=1 FL=1
MLYSAAPWLVSGVVLGYMGKHFMKRQKQEIKQLRALHREQEEQIGKLQAKLTQNSTNKATEPGQPSSRHVGHNKVIFLKNLLEANMRLREDIQNKAYTAKPAVRTANEK